MQEKKQDKRSKRTRAALESTLLRLLKDYEIDDISIKKLCEEADVNRTTFYLHYTSVYDVLNNIREEFIMRVLANFTVHKFPHGAEAYTDFLKAVKTAVDNTPMLDSFIITSKEAGVFTQDLKNSFYEKLFSVLVKEAREDRKQQCAYVTVFLCSGVIDAYILWLKNGKNTPFEILSDSFSALIRTGHSRFMPIDFNERKA